MYFVIRVILVWNWIRKFDWLIVHASQLLNHVKRHYTCTKCETLTMVYALHKVCHYLLSNKFALVIDLVNKLKI